MTVPLHGLFGKRVAGDDALLALSRTRFEQVGLAAELYAGSPEGLERALRFAPAGQRPPTVHLSRDLDLLRGRDRAAILELVRRFGARLSGLVLHDRKDTPSRLAEVPRAAAEVSRALVASGPARLYVEYAAGSTLDEFVALGERLAPFERVGLCIDIGHVGIRQARRRFAERAPQAGVDLAELTADDARLPDLVDVVVDAVAVGSTAATTLVNAIGGQPVPVHLHLHDGHPLIRGLSDHYAFQWSLPIPFAWQGRRSLPSLYGVVGLAEILRAARERIPPERLSLTLEIHQGYGRLRLDPGDAEAFRHWVDLTNAERQNAWLAMMTQSAALVRGLTALDAGR
ncbi:MAG: hypothetical protein ACOYBY_04525 [Dermatophilaceae bacterium]